MRWAMIVSGLCLLLMGAYLDNCRGPLLPVLNAAFSLGYAQSSWFLVGGYLAAIVFTLILIPISQRRDERWMSLAVCGLGAVAVGSSLLVTGPGTLAVLAVLLGWTVSGAGSMSNLLVLKGAAGGSRSRFLCFLHMMYGVGSFLAPTVVGWSVGAGAGWSTPLLLVMPLFFLTGAFLWRAVPPEAGGAVGGEVPFQSARLNAPQGLVLLIFACYVGGEVSLSTWMVPFLVEHHGLSVAAAAPYATGFFAVMAVTRGLCFVSLPPHWERGVLAACLPLSLGMFALGRAGWLPGLALAGLLGPCFPLLLARVSDRFPRQTRPLTLWIITVMQVTLAGCHLTVGRLTDRVGIEWTYWLPFGMLAGALVTLLAYLSWERGAGPSPAAEMA